MASDFTNYMTAGTPALMGGAAQLFGGIFGDSGKPYDQAMEQYKNWAQKGEATQKPYLDAGQGAISDFQNWLKTQKDPSGFINNLMGQYQQSPYAQYLQQQSVRAGQNAASASGLTGSTPFADYLQQNAANISSQDQQAWLKNVLGINTQYGQGQESLMKGGQGAANSLTDLYNQTGQRMGEGADGKEAGGQNDMWNKVGGMASIISMFL